MAAIVASGGGRASPCLAAGGLSGESSTGACAAGAALSAFNRWLICSSSAVSAPICVSSVATRMPSSPWLEGGSPAGAPAPVSCGGMAPGFDRANAPTSACRSASFCSTRESRAAIESPPCGLAAGASTAAAGTCGGVSWAKLGKATKLRARSPAENVKARRDGLRRVGTKSVTMRPCR